MGSIKIRSDFSQNIPQELVNLNCFLNWKFFVNEKGKQLKVPVNQYGKSVSFNDPNAQHGLNQAMLLSKRNNWGIGISLGDGLPIMHDDTNAYLWCFDYDGFAEVDGVAIDSEVKELLDSLNSYTEMSPSGTGFKTFCLSDKKPITKLKIHFCESRFAEDYPDIDKYSNRAIEVFSKNLFLAMTAEPFTEGQYQTIRFITASELDGVIVKYDEIARLGGGNGLNQRPLEIPSQSPLYTEGNQQTIYSRLTKESLQKVLAHIDSDDEQSWSDVSNALARVYRDSGREYFHFYSRQSAKYDEAECDNRYDRSLTELTKNPDGYGVKHLIGLATINPAWSNSNLVYEDSLGLFDFEFNETKLDQVFNAPIKFKGPVIIDNQIAEINKQFAWDLSAMNLYNISAGTYVLKDRFITQFANRKIVTGTIDKPKLTPLGSAWIAHEYRRNTPGIVMRPDKPEVLADGSINSWRGFSCEPVIGDVRPFIKLLKRLIPNLDERRYLLRWFAYMIQYPADKFNVALVIWSQGQGSGKSLLVETVGGLFNERHFDVVGQEVFSDAFTGWQSNKVFIICDEVSSTDKRATSDRIKGWITCTRNNINEKHAPKYSQPNLVKYVFLSNHADAVFIDGSDRRFFVVEASSEKLSIKDSHEFVKWRDNGGRPALLDFLQKLDTKDFNPTAPAPITTSKIEMVEDNKSDLERWIDSEISILMNEQQYLVSTDELAIRYKSSSGQFCSSKTISSILIRSGVKKLTKQARLNDHSRKRLYALKEFDRFQNMGDAELGEEYTNQLFKME